MQPRHGIDGTLAERPQDERLLAEQTYAIAREAKALRENGDAEAALALLERALTETPQDDRLLRERTYAVAARAKALREHGDAEAALALLERALTETPQDERLLRERSYAVAARARTLRDNGDAEAALALLERALAETPQDERLLREWTGAIVSRARTLRDDGDAEAALALIEQAMTRVPADSRLLALRASTLQAARRHEDALKAWRRLRERDPLERTAWSGMARSLYLADCPEQIEPLIDAYLGVLGDRWDRYVRAAYVAIAGRREATFQTLLERARAGAHDDPAILRALADVQLSAGGIGDALNLLDEACALAPEDEPSITKRRDALRTLQIAGIEVETLTPHERAALRMPDVALTSLLRRATKRVRAASHRIVMVHATLGLGGIERQLINTVHGLADLEPRPEIVLMPTRDKKPTIDWFRAEALETLGATIEPCQGGRIDLTTLAARLGPDVGDLLALLPPTLRRQIGVLASRFFSDRPAVVHAWSDYPNVVAGVAAALAGVPRIVLSSRRVATPGTRVADTYFHAVYRALIRHPAVVLVSNSVAGARMWAEWLGTEPANIRVLCNGVDIDRLEAARNPSVTAAHRAELGLPANAQVVGSLMRLARQKRPQLWLEAAAEVARRCPDAHFVILGDGPMREEMASAARGLGIAERLHMPGTVMEIAPWYDLMDVVLLTSRSEGTSNTALEAQALGVPVVSPDIGGMAETFAANISGFLTSSEPTPSELAEYTVRAMTDGSWRAEARIAGPALVRERFSVERMVRDTLHLYGSSPAKVSRAKPRSAIQSRSAPVAAVSQTQLRDQVSVFVSTIGAPTYEACLEHLRNQDCDFRLEVVSHVAPLSAACQQMIDRCRTPFYIQVDEDMLLRPHAVRTMFERLHGAPPDVAEAVGALFDVHRERAIEGLRIFRHATVRQYPFDDRDGSDIRQVRRLLADGFQILRPRLDVAVDSPEIMGLHGTGYDARSIYERYLTFWLKHRRGTIRAPSFTKDIHRFLDRFLEEPSELNFFALMGVITAQLNDIEAPLGEKDYRTYEDLPGYQELRAYWRRRRAEADREDPSPDATEP